MFAVFTTHNTTPTSGFSQSFPVSSLPLRAAASKILTRAFQFNHSGQFCKHAFSSLEEIVLQAIASGFTHYGLSEHMPRYRVEDLYEEEVEENLTPKDLQTMFEDYIKEARHLQDKYQEQIKLLVGMETDYIRDEDISIIKELQRRHSLDYIVGSVHHVNGVPIDFSLDLFKQAEESFGGTEAVVCQYYDHQYRVLQELRPDVIAHFDVIRIYCLHFQMTDCVWQKIVRNVEYGVSYGALFEVSTAGTLERKGSHPYPARRILQYLVSAGAKLTLSDDSHGTGDVGHWYSNMKQFLEEYDIKELYFLERDESVAGTTVIQKKLENVQKHPFWTNCK